MRKNPSVYPEILGYMATLAVYILPTRLIHFWWVDPGGPNNTGVEGLGWVLAGVILANLLVGLVHLVARREVLLEESGITPAPPWLVAAGWVFSWPLAWVVHNEVLRARSPRNP